MLNDIAKWLQDGANYQVGISLFEKYCNDTFLLKQLKRTENGFNRQKMIERLSAVETSIITINEVFEKPEVKEPLEIPKPLPELFTVRKQIDKNYAELRGLHALLHHEPEGEGLRALAEKVTRLGRANEELWQRYHYMHEYGEDPMALEPPPPPIMVDLHLLEKKEAIRKSLVKAKATARKQGTPKAKTLALIEQRTVELVEINLIIENIKMGANNG